MDLETLAEMLVGVWGQPCDRARLMEIGERVLNLERLLNVREGIGRPTDQLPERLLRDPLPDSPRQVPMVPLEALKTDFYAAVGWNVATGVPLPATLARFGLSAHVPHLTTLAQGRPLTSRQETET